MVSSSLDMVAGSPGVTDIKLGEKMRVDGEDGRRTREWGRSDRYVVD